jgi:hypothetical protein
MNHVRGPCVSRVTGETSVYASVSRRDVCWEAIFGGIAKQSIFTSVIGVRVPNMAGREPFFLLTRFSRTNRSTYKLITSFVEAAIGCQ